MNPSPLSQAEGIELIATKLMGWYKVAPRCVRFEGDFIWATTNRDQKKYWDFAQDKDWNPYEDENHFRMVLEKLMEDVSLFYKYGKELKEKMCDTFMDLENPNVTVFWSLSKATLPERMEAVVEVLLDSQKEG